MYNYLNEVDANFDRFSTSWLNERNRIAGELEAFREYYKTSYRRIVSLQAWRSIILEQNISEDSLGFFLEAQNDALVSHTLARVGAWRSALKSLRSCIENVFFCLYYMDHPVELQLWHKGKHRIGFAAILAYIKSHPALDLLNSSITGTEVLEKEYGTLSRAVHASAKSFRMTADAATTQLWSSSKAAVGAWSTREGQVLLGLNQLLMTFFRAELQGARLPALRNAISLAVPLSRYATIKTHLNISLTKP